MVEIADDSLRHLVRTSRHVVTLYEKVVGQILQDNSLDQFVDKVSIRRWRLKFLNTHLPQARYINIIRDGRDALCSARRHPDVWQSQTTASFARYWRDCVTLPEELLAGSRIMSIRYEDLTADPEPVLRSIMQFVEVDFDECQLDPMTYKPAIASVGVHQNLSKSVNTSSVERWRADMTPADQRLFERIAGSQLKCLGYSLSE